MLNLSDFLSFALISMMLTMGLGLKVNDFIGLRHYSVVALITLFGQLVMLPLLAFVIAWSSHLPPGIFVGLLLVSLCPGGTVSNFLSRLGKGNVSMSVCVTAISSLLTVFTLPFALMFLVPLAGYKEGQLSLSFLSTLRDIGLHTLLPVLSGMLIKWLLPDKARRLESGLVIFSSVFFMIVISLLWYENWQSIVTSFGQSGVPTVILLVSALFMGYTLASIVGASDSNRFTTMLEVGIQNGALAFYIAVNLLQDINLAGPATVYTVAMILLAAPLVLFRLMKLKNRPLVSNLLDSDC